MSIYTYHHFPKELLVDKISNSLGIVVCIPCYNEPDLEQTLLSILTCDKPLSFIEIIVLINESDADNNKVSQQNELSYLLASKFKTPSWIKIHPLYIKAIPVKFAGVGLARKLALDEAAKRLESSNSSLKILACFDADSVCSTNYLSGLETFFANSSKEAVSIHYQHKDADLLGGKEQQAIYLYELHLRYFVQMQAFAGLPFAYHTVGSSMACTLRGYRRIGGMNKRKAGEDFYFLQKFIKNNACDRLHTITVFPSSRSSDRVPFGTGRAVLKMKTEGRSLNSYHYHSFLDLKSFVDMVGSMHDCADLEVDLKTLPMTVLQFIYEYKLNIKIAKLINNTTNQKTFKKALYQLFDAFQLMKYLHYVRDYFYADEDVLTLASDALKIFNHENVEHHELLSVYRRLNLSM